MDPNVSEWLNLVFRWIHVVAGITWIGHLYFFNFVNSQVAKTYDADSKKKVLPELMPRALYWFRWGAAFTFITGILLLGIVVDMGGVLVHNEQNTLGVGAQAGIGLAVLVVGFLIYDVLWKAMAKNEPAGVAVSMVLLAATAFGLDRIMSHRAVFIHIGALLGTIMAANVWMRIWPAQRKIIASVKGEAPAPDAAVAATAGLRSKQNTYMSVPLVFLMVSNHFPGAFDHDTAWAIAIGFVVVGFAGAKWMFMKAPTPAPAKY